MGEKHTHEKNGVVAKLTVPYRAKSEERLFVGAF